MARNIKKEYSTWFDVLTFPVSLPLLKLQHVKTTDAIKLVQHNIALLEPVVTVLEAEKDAEAEAEKRARVLTLLIENGLPNPKTVLDHLDSSELTQETFDTICQTMTTLLEGRIIILQGLDQSVLIANTKPSVLINSLQDVHTQLKNGDFKLTDFTHSDDFNILKGACEARLGGTITPEFLLETQRTHCVKSLTSLKSQLDTLQSRPPEATILSKIIPILRSSSHLRTTAAPTRAASGQTGPPLIEKAVSSQKRLDKQKRSARFLCPQLESQAKELRRVKTADSILPGHAKPQEKGPRSTKL